MRKKLLRALIFIMSCFAFAQDLILVADFVHYQDESSTEREKNAALEVYSGLKEMYFKNLIRFEYVSAESGAYIMSSLEAEKLAIKNSSNFVLYGYVRENERTVTAELKLYDAAKKQVIKQFYSLEEKGEQERFIKELCLHIRNYFYEEAGIENADDGEAVRDFEVKVPFSLGYWLICDRKWSEVLYPVICLTAGAEFIPGGKVMQLLGREWNVSIRPALSYSYAFGNKKYYESYLNDIGFSVPLLFNLYLTDKTKVSAGSGLFYEADILSFKKKYEEKQMYFENRAGFSVNALYSLEAGKNVEVFVEAEGDFYFTEKIFNKAKVKLGASYSLNKKGVRK